MKIIDLTSRSLSPAFQFSGHMDGKDLIIQKDNMYDPLVLRIELTKGEIGLIKHKTKNEGNPTDELLEKVMAPDFITTMTETLKAMERVLRLANTRPISQKDLVRLGETKNALEEQMEALRASVHAITKAEGE